MRIIRNILFFLITVGVVSTSLAQQKKLVQFSGVIHNADTNVVVPYVSVTNLSYNNYTVTANHQGYFSFVAHEGDTILFTSVGYLSARVIIPKVPEDKYTAMVNLPAVIMELPIVTPNTLVHIEVINQVSISYTIV